jgi:dihydrodipicolinate synthase/N-acetylneuraminate lyase
MLKLEERKEIAETVVREASGLIPVVVQVGCADTASTIELARHAERVGADAVASLTPYYYKPGEKAVVKHYETIAKSVTIPLFAYNIPQFTGNNLQPAVVAGLAKRGTLAGVKDSSRDVLQLLDLLGLVPEGFVVMNGTEEYALFAMIMGGDGLVSGGANAFPELFESLVRAYRAKDYQAASAAQGRILTFKDAVRAAPISAYYEVLRQRGIDCGAPRSPLLPLDRDLSGRMMRKLRKLGLPSAKG